MKNIKEKILFQSRKRFNQDGLGNVSIRQISRDLGISHSNLIYHFKNKNEIIDSLHQQILENAITINKQVQSEKDVLKSLFISTYEGFKVIYQYRFFLIDLNLIMRQNGKLHQEFLQIEKLRFSMYQDKIEALICDELMKKPKHESEHSVLITQIRVFSDYWVSSAEIYEKNTENHIKKYARLFLFLFYPYLTKKGKKNFNELIQEFNL